MPSGCTETALVNTEAWSVSADVRHWVAASESQVVTFGFVYSYFNMELMENSKFFSGHKKCQQVLIGFCFPFLQLLIYMSLDLLQSVRGLCFYEASNLPVECTRAFKQQGRAWRFTLVNISTTRSVCVWACMCVCVCTCKGLGWEHAENVLGFCFHFVFFFKEKELCTSA